MINASEAPNELTLLRELVATLQAALQQTKQENALLRRKIDALVRRVFGSSSERMDPAQLQLLLLAAATATAAPKEVPPLEVASPARQPRKERTQRIPDNLPVVEEVLEQAEAVAAPQQWRLMGQEVSEQLDYEPARFLRRRVVRRKYVP